METKISFFKKPSNWFVAISVGILIYCVSMIAIESGLFKETKSTPLLSSELVSYLRIAEDHMQPAYSKEGTTRFLESADLTIGLLQKWMIEAGDKHPAYLSCKRLISNIEASKKSMWDNYNPAEQPQYDLSELNDKHIVASIRKDIADTKNIALSLGH